MQYDDIGPEYVIHVYDPVTSMRGIIVLDSTLRGPAKGGIRMTATVDEAEVRGLARAMTIKCALADLPFGGGKSGIIADAKKLTLAQKEAIVRAYGQKLKAVAPHTYVAAPDIAMGEQEMRWIADEAGRKSITGKPADLDGIPHELGSTGWGVFIAIREAFAAKGDTVKGKTFTIQGFGNVGMFAAQYLAEAGAICVGVSDSRGTVSGTVDVAAIQKWKAQNKSLAEYAGGFADPDAVLYIPCDILVLAAQKDVITRANMDKIHTKMIAEGANIPMTVDIESDLEKRGIIILPDVLANAGGVISSYVEHIGGKESEVFAKIEEIIAKNMGLIAFSLGNGTREACMKLAYERLKR